MEKVLDRLELDSSLSELSRAWPWTEALAAGLGLGEQTQFAIQLCLEEALANIVLHGYRNRPGHPILVVASVSGGSLFLAIEDETPPFAPSDLSEQPDRPPADLDTREPGGNGIRLMRQFAASVNYELLPHGNRLTLGFPLAPPQRAPASFADSTAPLSPQVAQND